MASIYDIAKAAGVSSTTVSLILNDRGDDMRIAKKTQERVRQAARELNYMPNVNARRLISKKIPNLPEIGLMWSPTQHSFFLNAMISKLSEMESRGEIMEMNATIYPFENTHLDKMEKILTGSLVHGLIIPIANYQDARFLEGLDIRIPVILLYYETSRFYEINSDNYRNGQMAGEIFRQMGLRDVGIIRNIYLSLSADRRAEGFQDYCRENGMNLMIDECKAVMAKAGTRERYAVGLQTIEEVISRGSLPKGLFVQDEASARGVVVGLEKHGIRVPEDVAVIGYGTNTDENQEEKRITLITFPIDRLAEEAWRLMNRLISGERPEQKNYYYKSDLFFGRSCPKPANWDESVCRM